MNLLKHFGLTLACLGLLVATPCSQEVLDKEVDWPQIQDFHAPGEKIVEGSGSDRKLILRGNGSFGVRIEEGYGLPGDEGYYVYTEKQGSWTLQAKLFPWLGPSALMIRESGEDPACNLYAVEFGGQIGELVNALYRYRTGASGNVRNQLFDEEGNPIQDTGDGLWFRVTRVEPVNIFFGEYSPDGENWFIAHTFIMDWPSDTAAFGVVSGSGGDNEELGEVEVTNISFLAPPPVATREPSQLSYKAGDTMEVKIRVYVAGENRNTATITETVPEGWSVSEISDNGTESNGAISWNLTDLPVGETVISYKTSPPANPAETATWEGALQESVRILGPSLLPLLDITGGERVDDGLIALYTFEEGQGEVVNDISTFGEPMNLFIERPDRAKWGDGFIETTGVNHIESDGPATKILDACMQSNAITVEGWIKTSDINQNGPARIITCSIDASNRNFTLGQGRYAAGSDRFEMRFRTTENDEWQVDSPLGSFSEALTHVVWSRASDGSVMCVINNEEQEVVFEGGDPIEELPGDFSNWDDTYKFGLGNEVSAARAWLGQFHLVAIYDRALTLDEVSQNYNAGPITEQVKVKGWEIY